VGVALRRQHNRVCEASMVHRGATIVRCARCSEARREDGAGEEARPGWCSNTKFMVPSVQFASTKIVIRTQGKFKELSVQFTGNENENSG
jgi:hypothetical protein